MLAGCRACGFSLVHQVTDRQTCTPGRWRCWCATVRRNTPIFHSTDTNKHSPLPADSVCAELRAATPHNTYRMSHLTPHSCPSIPPSHHMLDKCVRQCGSKTVISAKEQKVQPIHHRTYANLPYPYTLDAQFNPLHACL